MRDSLFILDWKRVLAIAGERQLRQEWRPLDQFAGQLFLARQRGKASALERTVFRIIATKVAGVDNDTANNSGQAKPDDAPVKTGRATTPALPSIHPLAPIGILALYKNRHTRFEQVLLGRKKIIAGHEHRATKPLRGKIDQFSKVHCHSYRIYMIDMIYMLILTNLVNPVNVLLEAFSPVTHPQ